MAENGKQDVLLMAILVLNRDDVLAGASELGISEEQVTDELVEMVKNRVAEELGDWRGIIQGMVKDVIRMEATRCPLGMDCSAACVWQEVGGCTVSRGVKQ